MLQSRWWNVMEILPLMSAVPAGSDIHSFMSIPVYHELSIHTIHVWFMHQGAGWSTWTVEDVLLPLPRIDAKGRRAYKMQCFAPPLFMSLSQLSLYIMLSSTKHMHLQLNKQCGIWNPTVTDCELNNVIAHYSSSKAFSFCSMLLHQNLACPLIIISEANNKLSITHFSRS